MIEYVVVAEYRRNPSEGMQVVSMTLVDGLCSSGSSVRVIAPRAMPRRLLGLLLRPPKVIVFSHGPGVGVVLTSYILRHLCKTRIIWIATRPDLVRVPSSLRRRKTAHAIVCNRRRPDLESVAIDAEFVEQFIGIDPSRLTSDLAAVHPWPEIKARGHLVALHVGHLRRNRGLELLIDAKRRIADRIEIVVQGSPTYPPDERIVEELEEAGIHVRQAFVENLANLYQAADLYLFPANNEMGGAIDLPLGVLEAAACRCPVLSTDFGSLPAALAGTPGITFTTPSQFVADLSQLLGSPSRLSERPIGLPEHLHAARVTDAVARLAVAS